MEKLMKTYLACVCIILLVTFNIYDFDGLYKLYLN